MTPLPMKAKVMIGMVSVASLCTLAYTVTHWQTQAWLELAILATASALTSRFKVKIPGTTGSMSGNLPFLLLAITQLGLFSSLIVAIVAAIAQSYTPNRSKAKASQFLFNSCTLLNASGLAYMAYHSAWIGTKTALHPLPLVLAACTYFVANTAHVAGIIGFSEGGNPLAVWHRLFLWSFPNYVIGAGLAAIATALGTITGWMMLGILILVLFAVHRSYQHYFGHTSRSKDNAMAMTAAAAR